MDYNDTIVEESRRHSRQLRPVFAGVKSRWPLATSTGLKYRSLENTGSYAHVKKPLQNSFSFGAFNPYLSPPAQNFNQLSPGYQVYQHAPQPGFTKKPKVVYTGYNLSLPPPPPKIEEDFRPIVSYYSTTTPHTPMKQTNLLPFIMQSLKDITDQRKNVQSDNFAYFHLENEPMTQAPQTLVRANTVVPITQYALPKHPKPPQKVTPNSHYSPFSTVGGFYNNNHHSQPSLSDFKTTSKLAAQYNIGETEIPTSSTQSNYFKYNIIANQKMKNFYSNIHNTVQPESITKPTTHTSIFGFGNTTLPEFHPSFSGGIVSTAVPTSKYPVSTQNPLLKLEFDIPEFLSNLQSQDTSKLNPHLLEMLKYFKQLNIKPKFSKTQKPSTILPLETTTTTKRPILGYESYIKSLPSTSTKYPVTTTNLNQEYYDEEYPDVEETIGNDSDDDIRPPAKMLPYMPMSETMAPPRAQMLIPSTTAGSALQKPHHVSGYLEGSTTGRPAFSSKPYYQTNFEQHHHNHIPSLIKFPSDIFQELKHRLPTPTTPLPTTAFRLTRPSTTPTTTTTTTTSTTTTSTTTSTTTTRNRQTLRPLRNRGHNKWQFNKLAINKTNSEFNANNFRKQRPSAAPSTAAFGTLNLNVNMNLDVDVQKNR